MELELADEDEPVLYVHRLVRLRPSSTRRSSRPSAADRSMLIVCRYKMGECFLHLPLGTAQKRLEKDLAVIESKVSELSSKKKECESSMGQLKTQL
jgi:hypothetical protein